MPAAVFAVAAIVSAGSAIYSGISAANTADYNAEVAEQEALAAEDEAAYNEEVHRENVRALLSSQRSLYGKSGVSGEGSPLLSLQDTAGQGELDALVIRHGGEVEAAQSRSSANLYKMQGSTALTSGYLNAGSSLLSSASKYKTTT